MVRAKRKPILITGAHRSGTTWMGAMLSASPQLFYVQEPFHPRPGAVLSKKKGMQLDKFYTYICQENEADVWHGMARALRPRADFDLNLRSIVSPRAMMRQLHRTIESVSCRITDGVVLLKDPYALFSAEWIAQRFDVNVVVMIRHPAAFAGSIKVKDWRFDFNHWLTQPLLMRDLLAPFEAEIRQSATTKTDWLDQATLVWKVLYSVVAQLRRQHGDWIFVRHEDVSRDPYQHCQRDLEQYGVRYSRRVRRRIHLLTQGRSARELGGTKSTNLVRDSVVNISAWKQRLSQAEVARVRKAVEPIASLFYDDCDW